MKNVLLLALFALGFSSLASDCTSYVPDKIGTTWEYNHYSADDKSNGTTIITLDETSYSGDTIIYTMTTISKDARGKEVYTAELDSKCINGTYIVDMEEMMSALMATAGLGDAKVEIESEQLEYPSIDASVGTVVADATSVATITIGENQLKSKYSYVNRKVTDTNVKVTTDAGTYNCMQMEEDFVVKSMMYNTSSSTTTWFSNGVGMIKQNTYDEKGKLTGYMSLTKFTIPN